MSTVSNTGAANDYPGTSPLLSSCENATPPVFDQQDVTTFEYGTGQAPLVYLIWR